MLTSVTPELAEQVTSADAACILYCHVHVHAALEHAELQTTTHHIICTIKTDASSQSYALHLVGAFAISCRVNCYYRSICYHLAWSWQGSS
jgi:hypothetical protein